MIFRTHGGTITIRSIGILGGQLGADIALTGRTTFIMRYRRGAVIIRFLNGNISLETPSIPGCELISIIRRTKKLSAHSGWTADSSTIKCFIGIVLQFPEIGMVCHPYCLLQ